MKGFFVLSFSPNNKIYHLFSPSLIFKEKLKKRWKICRQVWKELFSIALMQFFNEKNVHIPHRYFS